MRILYGVQGTGNGHLARARALAPAMRSAGIELDFLFSGRRRQDFFDMEAFPKFRCRRGLTLAVERGRLSFFRTLTRNSLLGFVRDVVELDLSGYDLVLSDFEPITAWAARLRGVHSIGISHQCAFYYDVPKIKGYVLSKSLMRFFAPVRERVGLHWHHFDQPILPPLIEPQRARGVCAQKVLVYMGFEALDDVLAFLMLHTRFEFQVFAKVEAVRRMGHITIRPLSHREFHRHLADCAGVISNAGFELASECLALGKKLLVRPLAGQYEQLSNALALQAMSRATVMTSLDQGMLAEWLELPQPESVDYPDVASALAAWLLQPQRCDVALLADRLWGELIHPCSYDMDFGDRLMPELLA